MQSEDPRNADFGVTADDHGKVDESERVEGSDMRVDPVTQTTQPPGQPIMRLRPAPGKAVCVLMSFQAND
jgi:hypothetical protein